MSNLVLTLFINSPNPLIFRYFPAFPTIYHLISFFYIPLTFILLEYNYYTKEEYETLYKDRTPIARWKQLRPVCFELIRGNHTPLSFSIVLQLSSRAVESFLSETDTSFTVSDINGLFLKLSYKDSLLNAVTGTSLNIFSMDKSLEHAWDQKIQKFILSLES